MSSRWISTSFRRLSPTPRRLISACAALTSDDLPMPRAPHSRALLAGRPRAKRSVLSISRSRTRSTPWSSEMSTRLTLAIGSSAPRSARQTKASAASKSGRGSGGGARRSSASAMRASSRARSEEAGDGAVIGSSMAGALWRKSASGASDASLNSAALGVTVGRRGRRELGSAAGRRRGRHAPACARSPPSPPSRRSGSRDRRGGSGRCGARRGLAGSSSRHSASSSPISSIEKPSLRARRTNRSS